MDENSPLFTVSDFIAVTNQTLEYAFTNVMVEGEVTSFKVNQGKYVFFDLKDASGSVGCFMTVWQLRTPIEDGMRVIVAATPKLTQWGKFSLTVRAVRPSGEGNLKKSFELLRAKLEKEGLFATERKRQLPRIPEYVAVISSTDAAGYADFVKILGERWGGVTVDVAHVQVQGVAAPDQMIRALKYFNEKEQLPEVIVLIRGGGSADDLSAFNDELLVREIAASRAPTLVGVGHEVDVSLADMAADVRAATPSNAAQLLVPDRREMVYATRQKIQHLIPRTEQAVVGRQKYIRELLQKTLTTTLQKTSWYEERLAYNERLLAGYNPRNVLQRGYAIMRGRAVVGGMIEIEKNDVMIDAEVKNVREKA